jgi:hypothetical protein
MPAENSPKTAQKPQSNVSYGIPPEPVNGFAVCPTVSPGKEMKSTADGKKAQERHGFTREQIAQMHTEGYGTFL